MPGTLSKLISDIPCIGLKLRSKLKHWHNFIETGLNKIKEKKWIGSLGTSLEITGFIFETFGKKKCKLICHT